ncbi:MAG: ferrous iron transport protein A [Clostridia bacterium]|nr:ferrous iron transport protein A [Clostridia bacterium]
MQNTVKPLGDLLPGQSGHIVSIDGEDKVRRRLIAMGVTPGAYLVVRKFAPLGDPMEINIRNYSLALRKEIAQNILVDAGDDAS